MRRIPAWDNSEGSGIAKRNTENEQHSERAETLCMRDTIINMHTNLNGGFGGVPYDKKKIMRPFCCSFSWQIKVLKTFKTTECLFEPPILIIHVYIRGVPFVKNKICDHFCIVIFNDKSKLNSLEPFKTTAFLVFTPPIIYIYIIYIIYIYEKIKGFPVLK